MTKNTINAKNAKDENVCFCTKSQKNKKWKYLRFAASETITFEPIKIKTG